MSPLEQVAQNIAALLSAATGDAHQVSLARCPGADAYNVHVLDLGTTVIAGPLARDSLHDPELLPQWVAEELDHGVLATLIKKESK